MSYTNSPLKYKTTFKTKTTSPFCHEWLRVSHWEVFFSSSLEELGTSLATSSSSAEASGEGEGEGAKLAMQAYLRAMQPTRVFIWHISFVRNLWRVSILWSCAMIASRVTPVTEEEGAEVQRAEEKGETTEATGSSISTHGCFGLFWWYPWWWK